MAATCNPTLPLLAHTFITPSIATIIIQGSISPQLFLQHCISPATNALAINDNSCGICHLPLDEEDETFENPHCYDIFHEKCFLLSLSSHNHCPVCGIDWTSDPIDLFIAGRISATLLSLENTGRMDLSSLPYESCTEEASIWWKLLKAAVCTVGFCMQIQDIDGEGHEWEDGEARRGAMEEEGVMNGVANSLDGWRMMRCLVGNLERISLGDLRACASVGPEEFELGMQSSPGSWILIGQKLLKSMETAELEPDYIDIWTLSGRLMKATASTWVERFGTAGLNAPLNRFLAKVVVWSLMGCARGLHPTFAAVPT